MSILNDCEYVDISNFTGASLISDPVDQTEPQGTYNRNCEFQQGMNRTRNGFEQVWNPSRIITTLYSWVQETLYQLVYFWDSSGTGASGNIVVRNLNGGAETTILTAVSGVAAIVMQAAYRFYAAFFDKTGYGSAQCQVYAGSSAGVSVAAFHTPLIAGSYLPDISSMTATRSGAGNMGPGTFFFALVATSVNGYQTAVGPVSFDTSNGAFLSPLFITSASATNAFSVVVTPNGSWPSWVAYIQLVMTTTQPNNSIGNVIYSQGPATGGFRWFLVPGTITKVSGSTAYTFGVNYPDTVILASFTEITNTLFNLRFFNPPFTASSLVAGVRYQIAVVGSTDFTAIGAASNTVGLTFTATGSGSGTGTAYLYSQLYAPLQPHYIFTYSNRNVYLCRTLGPDNASLVSTIFVSDKYNPEYITNAFNSLTLPEYRDCVTGFALGGTMFLLGPSWTYAFYDTGVQPASWPPAQSVSGSIGTPWIRGVAVNPANGYAWVADHNGLYYFNGTAYAQLPTSYEQTPDWSRINMAACNTNADLLEVIDNTADRLIMVKCPLDGATVATHFLVWDYTNGVLPGQIKYCGPWCIGLDSTAVSAPTYPIGAAAIVSSYNTKAKEVWISCKNAGNVKRRKTIECGDATYADPTPLYDDDGAGIDAAYELIAVNQLMPGPCQQVGAEFRIRGAGQINITATSLDSLNAKTLAPITAAQNSLTPGRPWLRLLDKQSELVSYRIDNGAVAGAYFYWAAIRSYFVNWMNQR